MPHLVWTGLPWYKEGRNSLGEAKWPTKSWFVVRHLHKRSTTRKADPCDMWGQQSPWLVLFRHVSHWVGSRFLWKGCEEERCKLITTERKPLLQCDKRRFSWKKRAAFGPCDSVTLCLFLTITKPTSSNKFQPGNLVLVPMISHGFSYAMIIPPRRRRGAKAPHSLHLGPSSHHLSAGTKDQKPGTRIRSHQDRYPLVI